MADFYGTIMGADAYHTARGNELVWLALDETEKTTALLRASEWIDGNYWMLFGGLKTGQRAQIREWPRTGAWDVYDYTIDPMTIPREVEQATYEAALREAVQPGSLAVDFTASDVIKKASVHQAVSVEFGGDGSASDAQLTIPAVDAILAPILTGAGAVSALSGSTVRV